MSIFSRIFGIQAKSDNTAKSYSPEIMRIGEFEKKLHELLEHLNEQLLEHGFQLEERPAKEVFEKIVNTEENRYIANLVKLVCTFIQNFKTNGYTFDHFDSFRYKTNNVRTRLFLDICEQCYHEYSKRLKEKNAIDFEDMINGWSSERHTSLLDNGRVVTDEDNVNGFTSFAEA